MCVAFDTFKKKKKISSANTTAAKVSGWNQKWSNTHESQFLDLNFGLEGS